MVSKACDSQVSPSWRAALIPPWAAFECERTGWTLDTIPTETPCSAAASAARCPASPAPITSTSCLGMDARSYIEVTAVRPVGSGPRWARQRAAGTRRQGPAKGSADLLGRDHPAQMALRVDGHQGAEP